jgi:3-hydroxybutyryl-CoA dehydratase
METNFEYRFKFSQDDVNHFAKITGDNNPIHLDEAYASKTLFGRRIIHGFLAVSVFSKVFGTLFPGEGTIYLKQDMKFLSPMFVEEEYIARFSIIEIVKEKKKAVIQTVIMDLYNKEKIVGEAVILNDLFKNG